MSCILRQNWPEAIFRYFGKYSKILMFSSPTNVNPLIHFSISYQLMQMSRSGVCSDFIELLYSLGWPVKVDQHIGWTGHVSTSYNLVCKWDTNVHKSKSQIAKKKNLVLGLEISKSRFDY